MLSRAPSRPLITGVHATGKVKYMNLTSGLFSFLVFLPSVYLLFKLGMPVWSCFIVLILNANVCTVLEAISLRREIKFSLLHYFQRVYFHSFAVIALAAVPSILPYMFMQQSIIRVVVTCLFSFIPSAIIILWIGIKREYREIIFAFVRTKISQFSFKK
jgi:hypothetical protein